MMLSGPKPIFSHKLKLVFPVQCNHPPSKLLDIL